MTRPTLGSVGLAKHLGVSHRQIYWAARWAGWTDTEPWRAKGSRMLWMPEQIRRMEVAAALAHADPGGKRGSGTILPLAAKAVFAGPEPPEEGWAWLANGRVRYVDGPIITFHLGDPVAARGGLVVPIPELWPLEER